MCASLWERFAKSCGANSFERCLKSIYFPFLIAGSRRGLRVPKTKHTPQFLIPWLVIVWAILFLISLAFGPSFMDNTRTTLDVPAGTPSATAHDALVAYYPNALGWPPAIVLQRMKPGVPGNVTSSASIRQVATLLAQFYSEHTDVLDGVSGYLELMQANLTLLAENTLSADRKVMISSVLIRQEVALTTASHMADDLIVFVEDNMNFPDIEVGLTGIFPLYSEMTQVSEQNFAMIDGVALPVCVAILGLNLRSYKHMFIALVNLSVTILGSFAIMYPISNAVDIHPFAPSIMMSLGIAVCFDYSLFMLNRFREAMLLEGKETDEAVMSMLETAGHVVVLSGTTLLVTFLLLLIFPQNFLESVGSACSAVVSVAIIVNMTLTPCLLLAYKSLSTFEALPDFLIPKEGSRCYCKCCGRFARKHTIPPKEVASDSSSSSPSPPASPSSAGASTTITATAVLTTTTGVAPVGGATTTSTAPVSPPLSPRRAKPPLPLDPPPFSLSGSPAATTVDSTAAETVSSSSSSVAVVEEEESSPPPPPPPPPSPASPGIRHRRSCWFKLSFAVTKHPWIAFTIALATMIAFIALWALMIVTSEDTILFVSGSNSFKTLQIMRQSFDEGNLDPFYIILYPKDRVNASVLTPEYFATEANLIHSILTSQSSFVNSNSFTGLTTFAGQNVSLQMALSFLVPGSPAYDSPVGEAYRITIGGMMNSDQSAALIRIATTVHPSSQVVVPFIDQVRATLDNLDKSGGPIMGYLFGAYTGDYDVQNALYALAPYLYVATIFVVLVIVGASFHSVLVALRLGITIIMSLSWTYGLMSLVYQPGPAQTAFAAIGPSLARSSGVYWIIPVMSFSILVGLALDYDIFLMSRVVEFRRMGWSDRASICLAIEKTGGIITAAGVIMAVSFAGLLFPDSLALNQYGFSLAMGVTLDTFIVRTFLVPAVFTAFNFKPTANWWPGKMPPPVLDPESEIKALQAGLWHPQENP